jgi:hypothetical protein
MGNHYHIIIAGDGNRVSAFANYLNGEIAKRMFRLFPGRWGVKFWQHRFKEQLLGSPEAVEEKIGYIFCNPLRARLVSRLSTYPGVSSIAALNSIDKSTATLHALTLPKHFRRLKSPRISHKEDLKLAKEMLGNSSGMMPLRTDLFAWVRCFKQSVDRQEVVRKLRTRISEEEQRAMQSGVIGVQRLKLRPLNQPYTPEKKPNDRTPFVECPDPTLRKELIEDYREFKARCRTAWKSYQLGHEAVWPLGAFVPSMKWRAAPSPHTG